MKLIVLKGEPDAGKTVTINYVYNKLRGEGYIESSKNVFKDLENGSKILASIDDLSESFDKSVKNIELRNNKKLEEKELNLNNFKIENFKHKCYEYDYYEDNEKTYSISCGIMIKGYLLTINLYSASKEEVENAIKYIYSVEKIN